MVYICLATQTKASSPVIGYDQVTAQEQPSAKALLTESHALELDHPDAARELAQKAIALSIEKGDRLTEIKGYYQLGSILIRQGLASEAYPKFEKGLAYSIDIRDEVLTAEGNYHMSRYYEGEGNYEKALEHINVAREFYEKTGNRKSVAYSLNSLGRIYQELGRYVNSLSYYYEALGIHEDMGNTDGISVVKTNIGNVFLVSSRLEDAIRYFSEALAIDKEAGNRDGMLINYLNLGAAYNRLAQYDAALSNFNESLSLALQLNYAGDQAILYGNIGNTQRYLGHPEEGLIQLQKALDLEHKNGYSQAHTLNDLAETYLQLKMPDKALNLAYKAIDVSIARSDPGQLQYAYGHLAGALEQLHRYDKAVVALRQSNKIRDSIFSSERENQLSKLHISYETEKKVARIDELTQEKQTAEFKMRTYIIIGVLACLSLFLLYYNQRVRSSKNHQLFEKEHEIAMVKSRFFSNISHEFRTPLTLILGPIEILREKIDNTGLRSYLDTMRENANRLLTLINQLLDLSKLEAGKISLEREVLDAVTLVRGVTMTFTSLMETNDIQLSVTTSEPEFLIRADQEKLETILINLLSNAFKHSYQHGKISVSVKKVAGRTDSGFCEITIQDTGKGIAEENIDLVFTRYFQDDAEPASDNTGYGLGLALTRELVELHKGSIALTSKLGEGTRVVVRIPVGEVPAGDGVVLEKPAQMAAPALMPETGNLTSEAAIAEADGMQPSHPRLLLIEDNQDVIRYLKGILSDDYTLLTAADGEKGINMALEHIPDLVISDVMMPKANGYEVCMRLKNDEKTSHVPIVLLTAKAANEDKIEGLSRMADAYITKPFLPKELLLCVRNLIASRKALRERYNQEVLLKPEAVYLDSLDATFLRKLKETVDNHLDDEGFNMEKLGTEVGMSRSQIHRKLHALTNQSATQFIRGYRLDRARDMLRQNADSISAIAFAVGFSDPSYFSKCFHQQYGITPSEAQDRGV